MHPSLESLQTQGTRKFLSGVVTLGFHILDKGVSLEFPGAGPVQPRPESASRLLRSYSHLTQLWQRHPSLHGGGERGGGVLVFQPPRAAFLRGFPLQAQHNHSQTNKMENNTDTLNQGACAVCLLAA